MTQHSRKVVKETLFYIAAAIVVLIALFPFYRILRTSLESHSQVAAGVGGSNDVIPSHLSGSAYVSIFRQQHFLEPLVLFAQRRIVSGLTAGSFR